MSVTANKLFRINVSKDNLTATLSLNGEVPPSDVSTEQIEKEITDLGIQIDEQSKKNIAQFAAELAQQKIPEVIVAAQGTPPQHDQNGRIEKLYESLSEESDAHNNQTKSHYDRSNIISVSKDQQLLRLIPPVDGTDGVNIYGKSIPHKLGREVQIKLGPGVEQKDDIVIAAINGKLEHTNEKIWVVDKLEIPGNVDFSVGNIDFDGEIEIRKNVLDLFKVHSKSSITVHGIIEAAEIHAEKDLNSLGGVAGKEKGEIIADQNINAKYITNAYVRAGQDINVHKEIVNCDLACKGSLTIENGPLVGGHTLAFKGVKVKYLGSEADVKTLVEVGIDEDLQLKCDKFTPEIQLLRRKAEKVRQVVEPLIQNQKYLNSEQKEKATELIYQATELDDKAESLTEELRRDYQKTIEEAVFEIEIIGTLYTGVTIRFPRIEAFITSPLAGPLKIVPRKVEHTLQILAIDKNSGSTHALNTSITNDKMWNTLEKLLGPLPDPADKPKEKQT